MDLANKCCIGTHQTWIAINPHTILPFICMFHVCHCFFNIQFTVFFVLFCCFSYSSSFIASSFASYKSIKIRAIVAVFPHPIATRYTMHSSFTTICVLCFVIAPYFFEFHLF
eukprot:458599_1